MKYIDEIIDKRLKSFEADIVSGAMPTDEEFNTLLSQYEKSMVVDAVLNGNMNKSAAIDEIRKSFTGNARLLYENYQKSLRAFPEGYMLADRQNEISQLIENGDLDQAEENLNNFMSLLTDEDLVEAGIHDNQLRIEDVQYFKDNAYEELSSAIQSKRNSIQKAVPMEEKKGLARLKAGFNYMFHGTNPYDNQTVKVKKERVKLSNKVQELRAKVENFARKNKVKIAAGGVALLLGIGGIKLASNLWHDKTSEDDLENLTSQSEKIENQIKMKEFEVDEFHNFNINDEQTHIEKLQLLARAFVERGVPVVSEEECMKITNEGKLATTPEQLNNWYMSINLEDMDNLTFTKLMENADTNKEELTADYNRVNNLLGAIYTTKEESPFIYEFISNKEYRNYIKSYEETIIQNQKGNKEDLKNLINSRVYNPVAGTHSGAIGMLSSALIYQQANVYNVGVIGQDVMNMYNYNLNFDCGATNYNSSVDDATKIKTTFFSDDWAEYIRTVDEKFAAAIIYMGSERTSYEDYLSTLTDEQDDNKTYIEATVLPYLQKENVHLGLWDEIGEIANNINEKQLIHPSNTGSVGSSKKKVTTTTKTVIKAPETPEEKKVQAQVEAELKKKNQQSLEKTVNDFAAKNGATVMENADGDLVIKKDGEEDIVVDKDTMGAYDPSKDYQGPTFKDYNEYKEAHKQYVKNVEGVGEVVVPAETFEVTNKNVKTDGNGNVYDKTTNKKIVTGTEQEIDKIIQSNPSITQEKIVEESKIHYSEVDDEPEQNKTTTTNNTNVSSKNESTTKPSNTNTSNNKTETNNNLENDKTNNIGNNISSGNNQLSINEALYDSLTPEERKELEDMLNAGKEPVAGEIVEETYSDIVYGSYTITQLLNNPALCQNIPESILQNYPDIWQAYQNWLEQQRLEAEEAARMAEEQQRLEAEEAARIAIEEQQRLEAEQVVREAEMMQSSSNNSYNEFVESTPIIDNTYVEVFEPVSEPEIIFDDEAVEVPVQESEIYVEPVQEASIESDYASQISALEEAKAELTGEGIAMEPEEKTLS